MTFLPQLIQILLVVLIVGFIGVAWKLFQVLGDVRTTLTNIEATRQEVTGTLQRLETVVASTDRTIREEVVPTLQVARETLANVEVTTRAIADTTVIARRLAGQAEGLVAAPRLIAAGGSVAQVVAKASFGVAGSLLSGVGRGIVGLLARRHEAPSPKKPAKPRAIPPKSADNGLIETPKGRLLPARDAKKRK